MDELHTKRQVLVAVLLTDTAEDLYQPAAPVEGLVSRSQLLTHVALWWISPSGHWARLWPHLRDHCWSLGPVPSPAPPLLWNVEVLDLLCQGSRLSLPLWPPALPELRPAGSSVAPP